MMDCAAFENRLTGWTDVPLTERGVAEARSAGRLIAAAGQNAWLDGAGFSLFAMPAPVRASATPI